MKYVIVDFGAKYQYTHHQPLVKSYAEIIQGTNNVPILYLSKYADRSVYSAMPGEKRFILTDVVYGPTTKESFFKSLLLFLSGLILESKTNDNILKRVYKYFLTHKIKGELLLLCRETNEEVFIIFPTAEPLSFYLSKSLLNEPRNKYFKFRFRIVGGESRGFLSSLDELTNLAKITHSFPDQILVGYETKRYMKLLISNGFNSEILQWSPWPPMADSNVISNQVNKKVVLGFLGNAKKRKGFESLPILLKLLSEMGLDFQAIIQPAIFEWEDYQETINKLTELFPKRILITEPELSLKQLLEYVSISNLLVLPYDKSSYSINASGLLYHGSDYQVPVITLEGVGFEDEIKDFKIGILASNLQDMAVKIVNFNKTNYHFEEYNLARFQATASFILNS